jgi:hypothetical protein
MPHLTKTEHLTRHCYREFRIMIRYCHAVCSNLNTIYTYSFVETATWGNTHKKYLLMATKKKSIIF